MTMSKQDFELIAATIYTFPEYTGTLHRAEIVREQMAEHFADALASTNGMFKRDKFIRAATTGAHIRRSILPRT